MTTITILGAGNMARGIGKRAAAGGSSVQVLDRNEEEAAKLAGELGGAVTSGGLDADIAGDVVVLALPYDAALAQAQEKREQLAGKVVVDITNPVDFSTFDGLVVPADSSAAQQIQEAAPDARVVKAFNTTFAGTLDTGQVAGEALDVFIAGDDAEAKESVSTIVREGGMRAIDAGTLKRARELEAVGFLHMALQGNLGNTWSTAVKVLGA